MQEIYDVGFAKDGQGYYTTRLVRDEEIIQLSTHIIGQRLLAMWEGILGRIPVVKSIYGGVKQVSDTLFSGSGHAFRKVLLVRYPHPQAWSLAFQTNVPADVQRRLDGDYVAVFIPTTPSPVNGFYFYVKRAETIELDMSVDDALKYIISMGVFSPGANGRKRATDLPPPPPQQAAHL